MRLFIDQNAITIDILAFWNRQQGPMLNSGRILFDTVRINITSRSVESESEISTKYYIVLVGQPIHSLLESVNFNHISHTYNDDFPI